MSTTQTLTCPVTTGQTVVAGVYINSTTQAVSAPTGFTQIASQPNSSGELVVFSHSVGAGDTGSYAFTWGVTNLYSTGYAYVVSAANGIDVTASGSSASGSATLSVSANPRQADLPLAFFGQNNNSHAPVSISWTQDQAKGTGGVYLNTQHNALGSASQTASVTYDSAPVGKISGVVVLVAPSSASTPTPTPSPTPSATPPPAPRTMVWFGQYGNNINITAAQALQWLDQCNGQDKNMVGSARIFSSCNESFQYAIFPDADANKSSGHSSSLPWQDSLTQAPGKTACPASAMGGTGLFATGTPDYTSIGSNNWFVYTGSIGDMNTRAMAAEEFGSPVHYVFFMNLNSTTLQSYIKSVLDGCIYAGNVIDSYTGLFADNVLVGKQQYGMTPYGSSGIVDWKNMGAGSMSSPSGNYAMSNCNGGNTALFNGVFCSTTSQISTLNTSTTYPGDLDYVTAFENFFPTLTHNDNVTPFKIIYNGLVSGYQPKTINTVANIEEGVNEHAVTQNGSNNGKPQTDKQQWENLDTCSANAAWSPSVMMANLDDASSTTSSISPLGSALSQQDLRLHYGLTWACRLDAHPQMMVSWMNFCGDQATSYNCVDIWPGDFATPDGRINTYQGPASDASGNPCGENVENYYGTGTGCTQGGARDPNIQATCGQITTSQAPCLFIFEWQHFWVWNTTSCSTYDRTKWGAACLKDIGPMVALANFGNGATYTLSAANLQSWIGTSLYAQLNHVLAFCTPSGYFNSTGSLYPSTGTQAVCTGTTGSDVANGGVLDYTTPLSSILNTTLPDTDWVFLTHG